MLAQARYTYHSEALQRSTETRTPNIQHPPQPSISVYRIHVSRRSPATEEEGEFVINPLVNGCAPLGLPPENRILPDKKSASSV